MLDISREWGLCVKVLVLTFQNVERDGTTGEQGLCKGETKELRGLEDTMENQETKFDEGDRSIDSSLRGVKG